MNSSADIKAFCGTHGGVVCTSSNARTVLEWAFERGEKVLFFPDQHLGRNTAVLQMGIPLDECVVYDPRSPDGGLTAEQLRAAKMILWRGHCSVHGRFTPEASTTSGRGSRRPGAGAPRMRARGRAEGRPDRLDRVHHRADRAGAGRLANGRSAPRSTWCSGWRTPPGQEITFLEEHVCYCATMNRIDLPHLVWALENLVAGHVVNQIVVDPETASYAKDALQRMLDLPGPTARD